MALSLKSKILWTIGLAPVSAAIGYFARGVIEAWGILDPYAEQFGRFLRSTNQKLILDFAAATVFLVLYLCAIAFIWWVGRKRRGSARLKTPDEPAQTSVDSNIADRLANAFHMPSGTGMHVIVDTRKKMVQIGFNLKNSSAGPIRYQAQSMAVTIKNGRSAPILPSKQPHTVAGGETTTYFAPPIPQTIGKRDIIAEAAIVYQYGPIGVDWNPAREAKYRVELTISPKAHHYVIIEENDYPI